jgi:hypothetical protein
MKIDFVPVRIIFASPNGPQGPRHYPIARLRGDEVLELLVGATSHQCSAFDDAYLLETVREVGDLIAKGWVDYTEGEIILNYLQNEMLRRL